MTKHKLRQKYNAKRETEDLIVRTIKRSSYMYHTKVRRVFRQWLKKNIHRFDFQPYSVNKQHTIFRFKGIITHIELVMDYQRPEAMIFYLNPDNPKRNIDHTVIEYIGLERYDTQKGYYDADRVDHIYEYFPTQEMLYIHNVFERIIAFVNEKFVAGSFLYVYDGDWTEANVVTPKEFERLLQKISLTEDNPNWYVMDLFTGEKYTTGAVINRCYHRMHKEIYNKLKDS